MQVQKRFPDLLVIVITGYATIENAVKAIKNGAYDFIPKPFTPDQLRLVVQRAIENLTLKQEAERLRLEKEKSLQDIANEKSRTLTIINHMADGVLVTDHRGSIVLHNPAVTRMLGSDESSPLGKNVLEWTGNKSLADMHEKVLKMDDTQGISLEIAWGDPPESFFMAHSAPVRSDAGTVLGSVTIFNDVTLFKELDQMKSDFVNMVSHELRSPLSSIRQQISVIVEGLAGETSDKQDQILSRVQQRIDGHIAMISNLLDLSRIEAGKMTFHFEEFSLKRFIENIIDTIKPMLLDNQNTMTWESGNNIDIVYSDITRLKQILYNLLSNATKFTQNGTVTLKIYTSHDEDDKY